MSDAELALLDLVRAGRSFALTVLLSETGEWVVTDVRPPFDVAANQTCGIGMSFDAAWRARRHPDRAGFEPPSSH